MKVGDLMQRDVLRMTAGETLDIAQDVMRLGGVRHIPVVEGETLVGILSQRDLLHAAASSLLQLALERERGWLAKVHVREVMTTRVHTVAPEQPVAEAVALLLEQRVGCLPVVEDGRLVGIVTETDCLRHLARALEADALRHALPELPSGD